MAKRIISFPFDDSANYTFDAADVEVTGGVARIKSGSGTDDAATYSDPMDSGTGKTFDASKVEFTGGAATLLDQGGAQTLTENFNDAVGITFNTAQVEIAGGAAAALKEQQAALQFNEDFATDAGFTYDSAKAEFTGGQVQQKSQRPAGSTFFAGYSVDEDGDWGDGDLTGTLVNGATVSGGYLDCTGGVALKHASYVVDAKVTAIQQTGCIRFVWQPNYSGSPTTTVTMFTIAENTGTFPNLIQINHLNTGAIRLFIRDTTGTDIVLADYPTFSPTAGTDYEFEVNFDLTTGATRLFIDGTQTGTTDTSTGTRNTTIDTFLVGTNITSVVIPDFKVGSFVMFSTVQHTANYTPGPELPATTYLSTDVTLPSFTYSGIGGIISLDNFSTIEGGSPRYTITNDGTEYYWSGAAWIASSATYATSNDATTIDTNIGSLSLTNDQSIIIKAYYTDSNTQSNTGDLTVDYTGNTGYLTSDPVVVVDDAAGDGEAVTAWDAFTTTVTEPGSDTVTFTLSDDAGSTYKYWSGAAWVTSDGTVAQSNTSADVNTNINAFPITASGITVRVHLHSNDGTTTPDIGNMTLDYTIESYFLSPQPVEYDADNIDTSSSTPITGLTSFTETATIPANTSIVYILSTDSGVTWVYWNGSAWVTSDETNAQANTASDVNTNIGTLTTPNDTLRVQFFLDTDDSTARPLLSQLDIGYTNEAYAETDPTITTLSTTQTTVDNFTAFADTVTAAGSDAVRYTLLVDDIEMYHSGSWKEADGTYAQTNTSAEVNSNIGTLLTARMAVKLRAYLHSNDGTTTPSLDLMKITTLMYAKEESFELFSGFTVGSTGTDIITQPTYYTLESSGRAWVNSTLRRTTNLSPVPTLIEDATNCWIWSRVLTQQASSTTAETSGGVSIQEIDFSDAGSSKAVQNLITQADAKMLEAKQMLSLYNDPRALSIIDDTW